MAHEFHSFYHDRLGMEPATEDFAVPVGTELDGDLLMRLIDEHRKGHVPRYEYLGAAYDTRYSVFGRAPRPDYKQDNRLAVDFAYDITETFEGYFIGIPMDLRIEGDEAKSRYLEDYAARNHQEDVDAEVSKLASKYGHAYEMLYQDAEGRPRSAAVSPLCSFMVFDDSVLKRPMYYVTYLYGEDGGLRGRWSDDRLVVPFSEDGGGLAFGDPQEHYFGEVPAIDFMQNSEKRGLYEGVLNLIEAYNEALSAKADDVGYFADAYMVVEGMELGDGFPEDMRRDKLINIWGDSPLKVYFLQKPDGDVAQENLISRIETLIFKMAMVPDITDESFSTASGTALKMRLMPMGNLARNKERKFTMGVQRRLRMLANYPDKPFSGDDWMRVEIAMHRNMPEDIAAEAQVAGALSGIVSEETQLSVLSCVDDPRREIERKDAEREARAASYSDGMPTERTAGGVGPQSMYKITSILNARRIGRITRSNAIEMLRLIGLDEDTAIRYLDDRDAVEGDGE
ncbi:phage portal protein [Coriobacteriales bacterium OH1046]|nr:phage portal protein [Coriobacteriales bacterium OH1046]